MENPLCHVHISFGNRTLSNRLACTPQEDVDSKQTFRVALSRNLFSFLRLRKENLNERTTLIMNIVNTKQHNKRLFLLDCSYCDSMFEYAFCLLLFLFVLPILCDHVQYCSHL